VTLDSKTYRHLKTRSLVIQAIRDYFTDNLYLEVETPIVCPCIIPESQIDPVICEDQYLQASPELCMKRLLSKGFTKIFQICKCFRKNERGRHHLPELTMLEWYSKNDTYFDLMNQCKGLIKFIAVRLKLENQIKYQGKTIHLNQPWQELSVQQAFNLYSDKPLNNALADGSFDEVISFQIEPQLGNLSPCFLYDYPSSLASLAKLLPNDPQYAQRFEFYIAGIELANGFTELIDPVEQKSRFEMENKSRRLQKKKSLPLPEKFLRDLEKMPDAAGIALGIDRLVMIFSDAASIDDVVAFTPENL